MLISSLKKKYSKLLTSCIIAIATGATIIVNLPAKAEILNNPLDQLSREEQNVLQDGKIFLVGEDGKYTVKVLLTASIATVWEVLTDYDNFENFLPNIAETEILENNDNHLVFEQVNLVDILFFTQKSKVTIAVKENYPQQINFNVIEGDIESLQGKWLLEPILSQSASSLDQVLITYQVNIDPGMEFSSNRELFFYIYQDILQNTFQALRQEINNRNALP